MGMESCSIAAFFAVLRLYLSLINQMKLLHLLILVISIISLILNIVIYSQLNNKGKMSKGLKAIGKLQQNNPAEIAREINIGQGWSQKCPFTVVGKPDDPRVQCVTALSEYENRLQGDALFGDETGVEDDTLQQQYCCCQNVSPNPQYADDISKFRPYCS
jgi:hypothetical protein